MATKSVVEKDGRGNQDPEGVWLVRENVTFSIKEKLSKLPPNPTGYCIYKVPERLKANNKDAFTPYVVSIGPFHHQDPRLNAMEDCKLRWLREFFKEHNSKIFATVDFVVRNEATIRQHYEDLGEISSEEFCEMILLDSVFILGLLRGKEIEKESTEYDILHDMMLIENQLPLFVPRTIYILSVSGGTEELFNNLVYQYFFRHLDHINYNTTTATPSGPPIQRRGDCDHHVVQLSPSNQSRLAHTSGAPTQGHEDSDHVIQLSPPNQSGPAHASGAPTQGHEDSDHITQLSPSIQSEAAHASGTPTQGHEDSNHVSQLSPPNQSGPAHTSGEPTPEHEDSDHVIQLSPSIPSEAAHFIECLRISYFDVKQQGRSPSENMQQLESGPDGTQQGESNSLFSWFFFTALCSWFFSSALCSCFFSSSKSRRSAKELHEAGVKFLAIQGRRLNNIEFEGGKLKIPPIKVNEWTETLFRNLIAFEQCKRLRTKDICDYIVFMDSLIDTSEDVDILSNAKIIKISLHDSEWVSNLFNNLYRENISERKSVHDCILKDLKRYNKDPWHQCKAKWYKWKQMLKNDYFQSPWSAISLIAATILLILTVIQTACSISSLPMPK